MPLNNSDIVLFHEKTHTLRQALRDLPAAFVGCVIVKGHILSMNAKLRCLRTHQIDQLGIAQECFRGNAADIEADSP